MSKKGNPIQQAPIIFISLGLIAVTLVTMLILCLVPGAGESSKNPVLALYGCDGNVSSISFENTLHAAGYEYEILDYEDELPEASSIVVAGIGEEALSLINRFKDDPHVLGFILICPEFNEEYLTGLTSIDPMCDIAIFAGKDNTTSVSDMSDARRIYERISGEDTIFGLPIKRGGLFASKVFINNEQNRMLSLSCVKVHDAGKLMFSPLFQNELAGYLSVTYIDEATRETSFGRINSWFILSWITIAFAVISMLLYLSHMKLSVSGNDEKKAPVSKWVFGLIGGISIAVTIGIIATSFDDFLSGAMLMIMSFLPEVFMLCLFIINFKWIYSKEGKIVPQRSGLVPAVFIVVVTVLYALFILTMTTDLNVRKIEDTGLATGLLAMMLVADAVLSTGLIYASRKSSAAGEGAKNCFGNRKIFLLMFIPGAAAVLFGMIPGHTDVFLAGLAGIALTGIPYIAVMPVVRHTDRSLLAGILHGIVYTLVLAAVL